MYILRGIKGQKINTSYLFFLLLFKGWKQVPFDWPPLWSEKKKNNTVLRLKRNEIELCALKTRQIQLRFTVKKKTKKQAVKPSVTLYSQGYQRDKTEYRSTAGKLLVSVECFVIFGSMFMNKRQKNLPSLPPFRPATSSDDVSWQFGGAIKVYLDSRFTKKINLN